MGLEIPPDALRLRVVGHAIADQGEVDVRHPVSVFQVGLGRGMNLEFGQSGVALAFALHLVPRKFDPAYGARGKGRNGARTGPGAETRSTREPSLKSRMTGGERFARPYSGDLSVVQDHPADGRGRFQIDANPRPHGFALGDPLAFSRRPAHADRIDAVARTPSIAFAAALFGPYTELTPPIEPRRL